MGVSPKAASTVWARMADMCRCGWGRSSIFRVNHIPVAKSYPFSRTARMSLQWGTWVSL